MPRNIGLRLALSATPERHFDEEGTEAILNYFGPVLPPELTLRDAIKQGALVRYLYHPILVELTEWETRAYARLTTKIGWALWLANQDGKNIDNDEDVTSLLIQRSRLIGAAANKLTALKNIMKNRLHTSHTLFYCGDGTVETEPLIYAKQKEEVSGNAIFNRAHFTHELGATSRTDGGHQLQRNHRQR